MINRRCMSLSDTQVLMPIPCKYIKLSDVYSPNTNSCLNVCFIKLAFSGWWAHHLIFVGGPLEHVPGPLDVEQDVGEDTDGVLVPPHHQVGKAHIVVRGDLTLWDTGVHTLQEERMGEEKREGNRERRGGKGDQRGEEYMSARWRVVL